MLQPLAPGQASLIFWLNHDTKLGSILEVNMPTMCNVDLFTFLGNDQTAESLERGGGVLQCLPKNSGPLKCNVVILYEFMTNLEVWASFLGFLMQPGESQCPSAMVLHGSRLLLQEAEDQDLPKDLLFLPWHSNSTGIVTPQTFFEALNCNSSRVPHHQKNKDI